MYKVFFNNRFISFSESINSDEKVDNIINNDIDFFLDQYESLNNGEYPDIKGINFICRKPKKCFKKFQTAFKNIAAAGGLVYNKNQELLLIYRNGKWDLPKGKVEKKEKKKKAAMREVEEECNVSNLKIKKKVLKTYHIYPLKEDIILKTTHWYKMETSFSGELKPQTEEGIEKVIWANKKEIEEALKNTYDNIALLLNKA